MRAHKEGAQLMLDMLPRYARVMRDSDYDQLYTFLKACVGRLPRRETVERHSASNRRVKAAKA